MILTKCRAIFLELNRDKMAQEVKERKCPDIVVPFYEHSEGPWDAFGQ